MNYEFPDNPTNGQLYGPAMSIQTEESAAEYLEALVQLYMKTWGQSREEATSTVLSNLGYYSGYYDTETMERVGRLFKTEHPIFGKIDLNNPPTIEDAFRLGMEAGRKSKEAEG